MFINRCLSKKLRILFAGLICSVFLSGAFDQYVCSGAETQPGAEAGAIATPEVAKTNGQPTEPAPITLDDLDAAKKRITETKDLDEESKKTIIDIYDKAIAELKLAQDRKSDRDKFQQARQSAPAELENLKKLMAQPVAEIIPEIGPDAGMAQFEQSQKEAQIALDELRKKQAEIENEPRRRAERKAKIPEENNNAKVQLEQIVKKLEVPVGEGEVSELGKAQRLLLQIQKQRYDNRLEANNEEILWYDATGELLTLQRDYTTRLISGKEKLVEFWRTKVAETRRLEADKITAEARKAQEEARRAHPVVKELAEKNAELAQEQNELTGKIEKVVKTTQSVVEKINVWEKDYNDFNTRMETAGTVTNVMGVLLLAKRNDLPDITESLRNIEPQTKEITLAQFQGMDYDRQWSELKNIEERASNTLDMLDSSVDESQREQIKKDVIDLLQSRRSMIRKLSDDYFTYFTELSNLDVKEKHFIDIIENYNQFIDENILWVKSSLPLSLAHGRQSLQALGWLVSPGNWMETIIQLVRDIKTNIGLYVILILIIFLFIYTDGRCRKMKDVISERVSHTYTDSFVLTLESIGINLYMSLRLPLILWFIAWRSMMFRGTQNFTSAIAAGLDKVAFLLLIYMFVNSICMPGRLMEKHFLVDKEVTRFIRRHITWFIVVFTPVAFVSEVFLTQQASVEWSDSLGRLAFIARVSILAGFLLVLLRPSGALLGISGLNKRPGWMFQFRFLCYPILVLSPISFSVVAGIGYFYAARHLYEKMILTFYLIIGVFFLYRLLVRWLSVMQLKIVLQEQRQHYLAEQQNSAARPMVVSDEAGDLPVVDMASGGEQTQDILVSISQQSRRLILAILMLLVVIGIWGIWRNLLPALGIFNKIELWNTTAADGTPGFISLAQVLLAIVIFTMTLIIAHNFPGLLEMFILQRLPLDRGVRFAIATISRYFIFAIGIVLAFNRIGIGWSKVQWLVAAVSVGLGFGLQEIFANFISGLLILFEQPIRVDDIVTVDNVSGKVTKIRIRATTIRDWDRKEYIVPNKEFITGRLMNWTLSDTVNRIVVKVGIAYGSNVELALGTLRKIAAEHPDISKDPEPMVTFEGFGESSLDIILRCFLPTLDRRLNVISELHNTIDQEFRKAGIEIAFPQRDLHIRSVKAPFSVDIDTKNQNH
ncbi:MAG: mechanosensitive ion channel [Sedimentisphaerales bacterium]|nr:mechanosensitive ion channel [Sedimentisphaerales bacterium]